MVVQSWLRMPAFTWLETLWSKPGWVYSGKITHQVQDRWHVPGKDSTVEGSSMKSVLDLFVYLVTYSTEWDLNTSAQLQKCVCVS